MSFGNGLLNPLRRASDPALRDLHRRWWLAAVRRAGCHVDGSIEITGRKYFREWVRLAPGCHIGRDCSLWVSGDPGSEPMIRLGRVHLGRNSYLGAFEPIEIGDDSLVGAYSYIISGNHCVKDLGVPIREQGYEGGAVRIGRDVWLGCHVVVLPGVTIGDGAVVGAGAVVTKSVGTGEIWAGVPARKIGNR